MRKKTPPSNRARCCVGTCNNHTVLLYLQHYPICEKHWNAHCDHKFKYKHFKDLREYLGFPPIRKPEGKEDVDEDCLAFKMDVCIDVEMNVPVLMDEWLVEWMPISPSIRPSPKLVKWNGIKKEPLELYTEINGTKVVLLRAIGEAVRFSSEKAINAAIDKLQNAIDNIPPSSWEHNIAKTFKKSKFWNIVDNCGKMAEEAIGKKVS
jgi:hypothetical protein